MGRPARLPQHKAMTPPATPAPAVPAPAPPAPVAQPAPATTESAAEAPPPEADRRPLVAQLRRRGYELDLRRLDAAPPPLPRGTELACAVLVTRAADREAAAVHKLLSALGIPLLRLDAERLGGHDLTVDPLAGTAQLGELSFRPTVFWQRHYSEVAARGDRPGPAGALHAESWTAALRGLAELADDRLTSEPISRVRQLRGAAGLGVRVPRTLLTSRPDLAAEVLGCARVVVKAAEEHFVEDRAGLLSGAFPEIHPAARLAAEGSPPGFPVLAQEYLPHESELRVYFLDGRLHAFEVSKNRPRDLWLDPDAAAVRQVPVPPEVAAAVLRLAGADGWSLRYGAFDFLVCSGEPVFLEVNTAGDWRWFETRADTRAVTRDAVRMLAERHDRALRRAPYAGLTGRQPASAGLLLLG